MPVTVVRLYEGRGQRRGLLTGVRYAADGFHQRLVHLFGIEAQTSGVGLHRGDHAGEFPVSLALCFKLFPEGADLVPQALILDGGGCCGAVLPLVLGRRVDLAPGWSD